MRLTRQPTDHCAGMLLLMWARGNFGGTGEGSFLPLARTFSGACMEGSIGSPRTETGKPLHLRAKGVVVPD